MQRVTFRKWKDSGDVIAFFPDQHERHVAYSGLWTMRSVLAVCDS